tara:strand:+ start:82 stop:390 length:309 start_codon:yes stop_codon:yes gene_type:complete
MNKIKLIFITIFILNSCGGVKEAGKVLRNEKIRTTDEFLVKKKDPLELPPNYNELPEPGSIPKNKTENEKIKELFKTNKNSSNKNKEKESSLEKTILNKIKR